jgi:acyl-CoA synthetase (NDP forming)
MQNSLDALFNPASVALIGASAHPNKIGNVMLRNLAKGGFRLFPVNPKESEILGLRCYASIRDLPEQVDLAVITLPAEAAAMAAKECAAAGVRVVVLTASGFRETGPKGMIMENELQESFQGSGTRLLGPNTMGVFVPRKKLDTFLIPEERSRRPGAGPIAMVSQSGAVSIAFLEKAEAAGVGISACVGIGNKLDLDEVDMLDFFENDSETGCIAFYVESFADGRSFVEKAGRVTRRKPIVVLKAGRTVSGSRAAGSHTGAIASSSDALIDGALKQAGILRVYDEEELLDAAKALSAIGKIRGDRICVVASAGGFGVIAADFIEDRDHGFGLRLAKLTERTRRALREVVPSFSSVENPVDLTASVTDEMYDAVLGILKSDPNIDGIMMSLELQPPGVTEGLIEIASRRAKAGIPIVVSAFAADQEALLKSLQERSVVAYPTMRRAIRALAALCQRGTYLDSMEKRG